MMIGHVVQEVIANSVTEIIVVNRVGKEVIENHFDSHDELDHWLGKRVTRRSLVP
jgi:UTP--glucose-1-phosphate uridylyltransferase